MGTFCTYKGFPVDGIGWLQQAKQLDPYFDPTWYWHILGVAYFCARRYGEAIAAFERSTSLPPWARAYLAASHALSGRMEAAQQVAAALAAGAPAFSAAAMLRKEPFKLPTDRQHLQEGLRKAGLIPPGALAAAALRPAIAVLPFANISGDPGQDYFADGLSEDIIADLTKISALAVTPRNAAFAYKGQNTEIQKAATELQVSYVLDGSVRRMGDRVRIATQLIDGHTGLHLWAERYDRPWNDILALRDEIAHGIVDALKIKLLPQDRPATAAPKFNAEAYQYYLMGRSFFLKGVWAKRALEVARQLFARAIEIDPGYAPIRHRHCDSYRLLGVHDSFEEIAANSARHRAGSGLAEAHAAKAWRYTAGRYGKEPGVRGRDPARAGSTKRIFLRPELREQGLHARRCRCSNGPELNRSDFRALGLLVDEYRFLGRHEESLAAARRCVERLEAELTNQPDNACALAFGATVQAEAGNPARAEDWANRAIQIEPDDVVTNYNLACTFAALGRPEAAMDRLRRAFPNAPSSRRTFIAWMLHDTAMDPLRQNAEFQRLEESLRAELREGAAASEAPEDRAGSEPPAVTAAEETPSIAVLPFANNSGDPGQDYFADGLSEDIIADPGRSRPGDAGRMMLPPIKAGPPISRGQRRRCRSATSSMAASSGSAIRCASPRNCSTATPAAMSGPNATTVLGAISWRCATRFPAASWRRSRSSSCPTILPRPSCRRRPAPKPISTICAGVPFSCIMGGTRARCGWRGRCTARPSMWIPAMPAPMPASPAIPT
jgi:adenylate cyclase